MSIDRSLKVKSALTRHRNVLTRGERIQKLKEQEKWSEGGIVFGLPKVAHRKSHAGKKEKAAAAAATAEAAAAGTAIPGTAAAPAAAGTAKAGTKPEAAKGGKPEAAKGGKPEAGRGGKAGKKE
jgi:small basic protein (TIGR04137 family)